MMTMKTVTKPALELTLAIIKPDVCKDVNRLNAIRNTIRINGFYFIQSLVTQMSPEMAKQFYVEHRDKFFYNRLVTFMSSGDISVHVLAKDNAIIDWRKLMGPTKVYKTKFLEPNSLRGKYGLSDTRNATHGSDSVQSFEKEYKYFFNDFSPQKWMTNEMELHIIKTINYFKVQ
ncbi:nucleoside diphosphate kinase 6-like [Oppia nitens]|uniref:nucleoside diphosphate kinase 6-like n=1 Tax=Oppia nitens TaxID=1686743 RepID=UPI0023DC8CDB|nr:nucleoside diphosphate kinase 6-like [Oppia nitens]